MYKDIYFLSCVLVDMRFFRYLLNNFKSPKALFAALISAVVVIVSSYIVERFKKHRRKNRNEDDEWDNSFGMKPVFIRLFWFITLCVVLLVSDGAIEYLAESADDYTEIEDTEETDPSSPPDESATFPSVGEIIEFGTFKQTEGGNGTWKKDPIRWIVIAKDDEKALLLSEKGLTYKPISSVILQTNTPLTWSKSPLYSWLTTEFCDSSSNNMDGAFTAEERTIILKNLDGSYAVGLLSKEEAESLLSGPEARICKPTNYAGYICENSPESKQGMAPTPCYSGDYWWLCDPGKDYCSYMTVDKTGAIKDSGTRYTYCGIMVRPTLWISIKEYSRLFG